METGCTCCSAICSSQRSIVSPCASACAWSAAAFSSESSMVTFIMRILLSLQNKGYRAVCHRFSKRKSSWISFWPALSPALRISSVMLVYVPADAEQAQRFAAERVLQIGGTFDHELTVVRCWMQDFPNERMLGYTKSDKPDSP